MTYGEAIEKMARAMASKDDSPSVYSYKHYARAAAEAIGLREMMEALEKPMTKEQAYCTHPFKLEMRWARYYDLGPKEYEGYTHVGYQNYGNQFNPDMCGLLWVRRATPQQRGCAPPPPAPDHSKSTA